MNLFTASLAAAGAFTANLAFAQATTVTCKSADAAKDVTAVIELNAPAGANNIFVTTATENFALKAPVSVTVGRPNTRLTGITWYQVGLFEAVEIEALVSTVAGPGGVHGNVGSSLKLNGVELPAICDAQ